MKSPCAFAVQLYHFLIIYFKRTDLKASEFAQHFIMIAGEIGDPCIFGKKACKMLDHLHVRLRPEVLAELPHVYDIAVEDDPGRSDGFQIPEKLLRMAAVGAQVYVG